MNLDNQRLRDIQFEKEFYTMKLNESETNNDCLIFEKRLKELEKEEKNRLARYNVII